MNTSSAPTPFAWQPLTGRGVAAFASAPLGRLLLVQFLVALLAASSVVWFLQKAWFPTIGQAIRQLPAQGELRSGTLEWAGDSPVRLAEGRWLAVAVDLDHAGKARSPAHVQVEFGRTDLEIYSLLGCVRCAYPRGWAVAFSRTELQPWWEAWAPAILAMAGAAVLGGLMMTWAALATVYFLPVWLAGFFADRDLSVGGSWRLAGAALMPGALLLCIAVLLYAWGVLDPLRVAVAGAAHLVVGWVYLVAGTRCRPPHPAAAAKENPFA